MFRKAQLSDCNAVYNLICNLENTELPKEAFFEIYREQLDDDHYYCLICELDNKAVGVLNLRFEDQLHHANRIAEIMELVVDNHYRNRGLGREIFAAACEIARKNGCIQIEVACNQLRVDTHRFYSRAGMKNFHYKFSKSLTDEACTENKIGR